MLIYGKMLDRNRAYIMDCTGKFVTNAFSVDSNDKSLAFLKKFRREKVKRDEESDVKDIPALPHPLMNSSDGIAADIKYIYMYKEEFENEKSPIMLTSLSQIRVTDLKVFHFNTEDELKKFDSELEGRVAAGSTSVVVFNDDVARDFLTFAIKSVGYGESSLNPIIELIKRVKRYGVRERANVNAGCHVLFGPSGSGKTTFVAKMTEMVKDPSLFIDMGEPTAVSLTTNDGLRALLINLLVNHDGIVMVDSLRGIVYSGSGSTLSGGVSADLVELMAILSALAAWSGNCLVTVVNPLTNDATKFDMLIEAIKGSSTSIVILDGSDFSSGVVSSRNLKSRSDTVMHREDIIRFLVDADKSTVNTSGSNVKLDANNVYRVPSIIEAKDTMKLTIKGELVDQDVDETSYYIPLF